MVTTGLKVKRKSETSSSVKKRIEEGLRADPDKVLEQREAKEARIFSRPTLTTSERNVEVTNLSPEERARVQKESSTEGLIRQEAKRNLEVQAARERIISEGQPVQEVPFEREVSKQAKQLIQTPREAVVSGQAQSLPPEPSRFPQLLNPSVNLEGAEAGARTTAQVIDAIKTFINPFSEGKQTEVIAAEGALNDITAALDDDITLVSQGLKNPREVRQSIQRAESYISQLESTQKGLGKLNLRYWLTDGKEVEAKVALEKENLEEFKLRLAEAERQNRIRSLGLA